VDQEAKQFHSLIIWEYLA